MKSPTSNAVPVVSFGLPVRNGAPTIARAIESIRAQTFEDWELIVSDNLSSDGTAEICASFVAEDGRVRHVPTGRNLTQNENFCEVFRHSRGRYFRWFGDDDWLEPDYCERTVAAFDEAPRAVLCTTVQRIYHDDEALPYNDPFERLGGVVSSDPAGRVRELLRLIEHGGYLGIDPVYSLVRRDVAAKTNLISPMREGDFTFACEMALAGPFVHIPHALAHRRLAGPSRLVVPPQGLKGQKPWSPYIQRELSIIHLVRASRELSPWARVRLASTLVGYAAREHADGLRRRARNLVGRSRQGLGTGEGDGVKAS